METTKSDASRSTELRIGAMTVDSIYEPWYKSFAQQVGELFQPQPPKLPLPKYRPARPVYAFCHDAAIARRVALYWGITPFVLPLISSAEATWEQAEGELLRRRLISRGDILAVVAGSPGKPGQTNQMRLVRASRA